MKLSRVNFEESKYINEKQLNFYDWTHIWCFNIAIRVNWCYFSFKKKK